MLIAAMLVAAACSKKEDDQMDLSALVPPTKIAVSNPEPPAKLETPRYFYPFSGRRDPFNPLLGGQGFSNKNSSQFLAQNFSNLELRGFLRDKKGKIALIETTSGESYILKSGRIYDERNHMVNGVTGIIKENSVVLISQNRTVKELFLRRNETN